MNVFHSITGSLLTVMGILLVILKLAHVIAWSWWIVLIPFWVPVAATILLAFVCLTIACLGRRG